MNSTSWLGVGFQPAATGGRGMNNADIVVGLGTNTVNVLYSNAAAGYPSGTPTLQVTNGTFGIYDGGLGALCFARALAGGHNPLPASVGLIWAVGQTSGGAIAYHGSDAHDPSGNTQTHRSDEVPAITWSDPKCAA